MTLRGIIILAFVGLSAALWLQTKRVADFRAERDELAAEKQDWLRIREIHERHVAAETMRQAENARQQSEIEAMEGGDAPLSDFGRAAALRVWGSN